MTLAGLRRTITATTALLAFVSIPVRAAAPDPTDVPVQKVVLFSSGVGYLEHGGKIKDNTTAELRFKAAQINDILKSLVLEDLGGGTVGAVVYPSQDPLAKTLKSFQIDISDNPPLAKLLTRVRGAKVQISAQAETIEGTVLGVESRQEAGGKDTTVTRWIVSVLTDGGAIRAILLDDIRSIELRDEQLQAELTQALAALAQARDQDKKPVSIEFRGQGERQVRIGYVMETPIWKTSYRLVLPDDDSDDGYLQGWAIVENQTDSDWNSVQLSLVSGRPISFVQDLYTPLYVPRPVVRPQLYASLTPQTYGEGIAEMDESNMERFAGRGGLGGGGRAGDVIAGARVQQMKARGAAPSAEIDRLQALGYVGAAMNDSAEDGAMDVTSSIASAASAGDLGELFQYDVGNVTLLRQRSAMIPIVTDKVKVQRLSIYNPAVLANHPLNGARMKNTSGKHLLQGPITVFDGGGYAGDANIDHLPPDDDRLLSYAVDLKLHVQADMKSQSYVIQSGKIVKGVLTVSRKWTAAKEYVVENKSDEDRTVLIEHQKRGGWSLVDTPKPIEETDTLYRFEDTVAAGKTSKLTVTEENIRAETLAILSAGSDALLVYSRSGEISKRVREALAKAAKLKNELVDIERQIAAAKQRITEITREQSRIRDNMKTVSNNSEYYNRLLSKLDDQESQIEQIQKEIEKLTGQMESKRQELEQYLSDLTVE